MRRVITDRDELGRLWLAWYVRRSDETQAADLTQHADDARRLRVAEFCADPDRFAQVRDMKTPRIDEWCVDYKQRTRIEEHGLDSLLLDDGWLLVDGNHRCSAIYMLGPAAGAPTGEATPCKLVADSGSRPSLATAPFTR